VEFHNILKKTCAVYLTPWKGDFAVYLPFGSEIYTGEAIPKQMKATTAFKGSTLQDNNQNFTLLSNSMMNMNFKIFKCRQFHIWISPWKFGKNRNGPSVPLMGPGEAILWKKKNTKKSRNTFPLSWWNSILHPYFQSQKLRFSKKN